MSVTPINGVLETLRDNIPVTFALLAVVAIVLVAGPAFGGDGTNLPTTTIGEHPEEKSGNDDSCPGDAQHRFKIEGEEDENPDDADLNSGTYTDEETDTDFTLTVPSEQLHAEHQGGPTLDFSIDGGSASAVILKGGPNFNLYHYANLDDGDDGFEGLVSHDTYLHSPPHPQEEYAGLSHITFCYDIVGQLEVEKFIDVDQDGVLDDGDVTSDDDNLKGWEFNVFEGDVTDDTSGHTPIATLTTDSDGKAGPIELNAGTYTVEEVISGETITTEVGDEATAVVTTENPLSTSVTAGEITTEHFGNTCLITKRFEITADSDLDGVTAFYDTVDDGAISNDATYVALEETEPGVYTGTAPDEFSIGDEIEWGFGLDTTGDGSLADEDPKFIDEQITDETFTVADGYPACMKTNTGELDNPEIAVTKFKDADDDGDPEDLHDPLEGWTIRLSNEDGELASSDTNSRGQVVFGDLTIGESYVVCEDTMTDWVQTYPTDAEDNPVCHEVGPLGIDEVVEIDFHNSPLSEIRVGFTDLTGFTNVNITCTDPNDNVVTELSTDGLTETERENFNNTLEDYRLRQGKLTCEFKVVDP